MAVFSPAAYHTSYRPSPCGPGWPPSAPAGAAGPRWLPTLSGRPTPHPACAATHPSPRQERNRALLTAGALALGAALSHRLPLPARQPLDGFKTLLPTDWKVWARVLMGVGAMHQVNRGMGWNLPPWLDALETLAVVTPLSAGVSRRVLLPTAVMAPVVMAVVQGTSWLSHAVQQPARERLHWPPIVTQLALSVLTGLGALLLYPAIYKQITKSGLMGKALQKKAADQASTFASLTFSNTCLRGCTPASFICLSELAEIGGSLGLWLQGEQSAQQPVFPWKRAWNREGNPHAAR